MGKARGAAPKGREGWPGARAQRGRGGLGRPPSATCRHDRVRLRGEQAAKGPGRAGRRGAEWQLQHVGARRDRGQSAPSARGAGPGLRRALRSGVFPRSPAGEGRPQTAPVHGHPRHPRFGAAPLQLPCEAFRKLGRRPPTAAQARAWRARGCPGLPLSGPDSGRRTALTFRGAGPKREASFQQLLLECSVRGGARAFKTLPRDSARWCQAGLALEASHPRGHSASQPAPGRTPAPLFHCAPCRACSSRVDPEAQDRKAIIWDTRMPQRRPPILPALALVGLGLEESIFLAGCWRTGGGGEIENSSKDVRLCPHCHPLRKRLKSVQNWSSLS